MKGHSYRKKLNTEIKKMGLNDQTLKKLYSVVNTINYI